MGRPLWIAGAVAGLLTACAFFTDLSGLEGTAPPPAEQDAETGGPDTSTKPTEDAGTTDTSADVDAGPACDANISSDPAHCGACFRSCLGGACTSGTCSPVAILTTLPSQAGVAVAAGKLYVSVPGNIRRYELDGTQGVDVVPTPQARYLQADATHLYWFDSIDDKLRRWPVAGGAVEELASGVSGGLGVAVSSTHAYFTHYVTDGGVERVQLDGGGREFVLQQYNHPEDIDFANGELIVGGDGVNELAAFANAGSGAKRVLSAGYGPCSMAIKDGYIYFGEQTTSRIFRVPLVGGAKELLADDAGRAVGVAVSNDAIYWREFSYDAGKVWRLAR